MAQSTEKYGLDFYAPERRKINWRKPNRPETPR